MGLREVDDEKCGGRPGDDEGGELNDGITPEFPGEPEFVEDGALIGLEEFPLLF